MSVERKQKKIATLKGRIALWEARLVAGTAVRPLCESYIHTYNKRLKHA